MAELRHSYRLLKQAMLKEKSQPTLVQTRLNIANEVYFFPASFLSPFCNPDPYIQMLKPALRLFPNTKPAALQYIYVFLKTDSHNESLHKKMLSLSMKIKRHYYVYIIMADYRFEGKNLLHYFINYAHSSKLPTHVQISSYYT